MSIVQKRATVNAPVFESLSAEAIRRRFTSAWGRMGTAWGVAPSTSAVHGYLLLHGGPLTQAEIRVALGVSHRATRVALAECEAWGIIERSPVPRRSGRRGPAGTAWVSVTDNWEWFRRVAAARKQREADPVIAVIEECLRLAGNAASDDPDVDLLRQRLGDLLVFVHRFDRGVSAIVASEAAVLARLFGVLEEVEPADLRRFLGNLGKLPPDDLARAVSAITDLPPGTLRRLVRLAAQPGVARVIRALPGSR